MSMATSSAANATDDTVCANCSKAESDDAVLKRCTACKMVRYCSRDCQVAHRPTHKKACKKRAAELFDEELFKDPPEREECPICLIRLPYDENGLVFHGCCGKVLCAGCVHVKRKEDARSGNDQTCLFCGTPASKTEKEVIDRLRKGVEQNNALSMQQLGSYYMHGMSVLPKDVAKALELFEKAGKLGCADAYTKLGQFYNNDEGGKKDITKAKHYWELGAIGGNLNARYDLSVLDWNNDDFSRSCKHSLINVKAGYHASLKDLEEGFEEGYVTRDEYTEALRAYQKKNDETKNAVRDEALVYTANPSLYYENS